MNLMNSINKTADVCVIGGGISGLTAAFKLYQQGASVLLLERSARVGGVLRSVQTQGFIFDCGANTLRVSNDAVWSLIERCVPPAAIHTAAPSANKRYILRGGKLHAMQAHPLTLLRTTLLTTKAKLRLLSEPFVKAKRSANLGQSPVDESPTDESSVDESLADFFQRRIGSEAVRYLLNPFVTGVYGAAPEHLSAQATFPNLCRYERESGSVLKGLLKTKWAERKQPRASQTVMTFSGGMQTLAQGMAEQLGDRVQTGVEVHAVRSTVHDKGDWLVETSAGTVSCLHCIVATEAPEAASLLALLPASLSSSLSQINADSSDNACQNALKRLSTIRYGRLVMLHLGYNAAACGRVLDSFGFLVPACERESASSPTNTSANKYLLGALWNSAFFPHTAPAGHAAFTLFLSEEFLHHFTDESADENAGENASQNASENAPASACDLSSPLLHSILRDFHAIMQIDEPPVVSRLTVWNRAIPRYELGYTTHETAWKRLEDLHPGLHLLGSYRGGVSLQDCMLNAITLANTVAERLAETHSQFHS
jgi:protoporphyrinogen/coproporphyrinogen III oxidase